MTVQDEVVEQISFACRKCGTLIEFDPGKPKTSQEQTVELTTVACKSCNNEFVKNIEDNSELCYQCRIDQLIKSKREREALAQEEAEARARAQTEAEAQTQAETATQAQEPAPEPEPAQPAAEPAASRYTFRNAEGLILGPIKLRTVAVLVREKRIVGNEEVARDGEDYRPLKEFPELIEFIPDLAQAPEAQAGIEEIPLEEPVRPVEQEPAAVSEQPSEPTGPEAQVTPPMEIPLEEPGTVPEQPAPQVSEPIPEQAAPMPEPASAEPAGPEPEPAPEPAPVIPSESEAASIRMDAAETAPIQKPEPEPEKILEKPEPEPKVYHLKLNGTREFGPIRKNTVLDLIECGFLSGSDQITRDKTAWLRLLEDEEFKSLVPAEEPEVLDLVETVEE